LGSGPICTSFFCAMYISNISLIGLETFWGLSTFLPICLFFIYFLGFSSSCISLISLRISLSWMMWYLLILYTFSTLFDSILKDIWLSQSLVSI
jgi:hypothetical protein